jgi:hypothetical protein
MAECCVAYLPQPVGGAGTGAAGGGIAISAGSQLATSGTVIFSNGNGMTFGMAGSASVTASFQAIRVISAAATNMTGSGVSFANSNGVSFGINGNTITASVATQAQGAISIGTASFALGTAVFADGNGVSFGLAGSTITASVASQTPETPFGLSAGSQSVSTGTARFVNSNGISFGMSGSSQITASYASYESMWFQNTEMQATYAASINTLSLWPVTIPLHVSATQVVFAVQANLGSNSTGSWAHSFGIYTITGQTANLASSGSRGFSFSSGSDTSASSLQGGMSGLRYRTIPGTFNLTPGVYLFALHIQTSGGNSVSLSLAGNGNQAMVGTYDGIEVAQWLGGLSNVSFTTAMPTQVLANATAYQRTGVGIRGPGLWLFGTT